ncbi:MAG: phage terminase large subunit [Candidatus Eremiobacteraeota bacterium]|nr:phage terminase large subunit [Candidatus Eremiobacteraeota bacterium]
MNPDYQMARHLLLLNRALIDVAEKRILRLIINIPVRHGKSETGSGYFPAYFLGTNPDDKVLLAGHSGAYAQEYGQFARDVIEQRGPDLHGVSVQRGSSSKTFWKIANRRGRMISRGIGGSFPGTGADLLIIDDPVKSPDEADSPAARAKLQRWYTGIARSRLSPDGATVLIMSRWRQDDFAGYLKDLWTKNDLPFTEIHLPALALENDLLGRAPGEARWPDFAPVGWTAEKLEKIRREVGPRTWNAQYQGVPTDAAGEFFKRESFRYYTIEQTPNGYAFRTVDHVGGLDSIRNVPLDRCRIMEYVDLVSGLKQSNDFTVVTTIAVEPMRKDIFVLDVFRARIPGPEQGPALRAVVRKWLPYRVRIESVAYQQTFVQAAEADGMPVEPIMRGRGDKLTRANYIALRYQQGHVFHPRAATWLGDFEDELLTFPLGAHDDQVDTIADAGNDLVNGAFDDIAPAGVLVDA